MSASQTALPLREHIIYMLNPVYGVLALESDTSQEGTPTSRGGRWRHRQRLPRQRVGLGATILTLSLVALAGAGEGQTEGAFRVGVMESLTGPGETYGTVAN